MGAVPEGNRQRSWRLIVTLLVAPATGVLAGYAVHRLARAVIDPGDESHGSVFSWDFGPATLAAIAVAGLISALYSRRRGGPSWGSALLSVLALPVVALAIAIALLQPAFGLVFAAVLIPCVWSVVWDGRTNGADPAGNQSPT